MYYKKFVQENQTHLILGGFKKQTDHQIPTGRSELDRVNKGRELPD